MSERNSDNNQQIDQIRNLIFGDQEKEYSQIFDGLAEQINQLSASLEKHHTWALKALETYQIANREDAQRLSTSLENSHLKVEDMISETRKRLDSMLSNLAAEMSAREVLGNYFINMGNKLLNPQQTPEPPRQSLANKLPHKTDRDT